MKFPNIKEKYLQKYRSKIRERAITQAKARIVLAGKKVAAFDQDELEIIVRDEEEKIKHNIKQSGVVALLLILGLA